MIDIPNSRTPLLMGHGKDDTFVPIHQANKIFQHYGCQDKLFYIFEAKHNSPRPPAWYEFASRFIHKRLGLAPVKNDFNSIQSRSLIHVGDRQVIQEYLETPRSE